MNGWYRIPRDYELINFLPSARILNLSTPRATLGIEPRLLRSYPVNICRQDFTFRQDDMAQSARLLIWQPRSEFESRRGLTLHGLPVTEHLLGPFDAHRPTHASSGSRTRATCLEGRYPSRWTNDAVL